MVEEKCAEVANKRKELENFNLRIKQAASANGNTGQRCSHCHNRNHSVRSCQLEKCKSAFFCGDLTRHSDEKMTVQEKKKEIKALQTTISKLEQEPFSREAAFDRVHVSVNKQLEDVFLEEYPDKYIQNNSRNWLKIQQDIAFVTKSLKGSGPPKREVVKSILERKKLAEYEQTQGISPLPLVQQKVTECKQTPIAQTLTSYGLNFPV